MLGITLMTDPGIKDGTVGVVKRVSGVSARQRKFHLSLVTKGFYGC